MRTGRHAEILAKPNAEGGRLAPRQLSLLSSSSIHTYLSTRVAVKAVIVKHLCTFSIPSSSCRHYEHQDTSHLPHTASGDP